MSDERRIIERTEIHLPLQVKTTTGELIDVELVDVSSGGLRVRGDALSILSQSTEEDSKEVMLELRLSTRLAWIEPRHDGAFDLGLKLETPKTPT